MLKYLLKTLESKNEKKATTSHSSKNKILLKNLKFMVGDG